MFALQALENFAPANDNEAVAPVVSAKSFCHKKLNILLVEDVNSDATLTRIALNATGVPFNLDRVWRGSELLTRLTSQRVTDLLGHPDLIVLDLGLPGMDGFEVLAELTLLPNSVRTIPIAILTGIEHFDYIDKSYPLCNIVAYINKPCEARTLKETLMRCV